VSVGKVERLTVFEWHRNHFGDFGPPAYVPPRPNYSRLVLVSISSHW